MEMGMEGWISVECELHDGRGWVLAGKEAESSMGERQKREG